MKIFRPFHLALILAMSVSSHVVKGSELPRLPEEVFPQLGDILHEALKQSPRMLVQQLSLEGAEGGEMQAKAGLYPTIGGYYSHQETQDKREDFPGRTIDTSKTYYSVSLNQPVFHWGERKNNARIGEIQKLIVERQYEEAYRGLAIEIRRTYLDLISYKSQLTNTRFAKKLADGALRAGEDRAAKKLISEGEVFPLRINAEQAALGEATLEFSLAYSSQQFEALTGRKAPSFDELPAEVPTQIYYQPTYNNLLSNFLGQREPVTPALEIMRQQIEINTLSYKNQRKRLLPKLSFIVGVSQDEQSYTINSAQKYGVLSQFVGLSVNWQIFDGFATRGAVRSALAQKRQSEESYRIAVESQRRQAESAVRGIELAYRQMAIGDKILDNSQVYLNFRREDFKRGNASEADVNQALASYYSAMVSANNARINFLMKQVEFVSLIARDPLMENVVTK